MLKFSLSNQKYMRHMKNRTYKPKPRAEKVRQSGLLRRAISSVRHKVAVFTGGMISTPRGHTFRSKQLLSRINPMPLIRHYGWSAGLGLVIAFLAMQFILSISAASIVLTPNQDIVTDWPTSTGGSYYTEINEGATPDTNTYIATEGEDQDYGVEFGMTSESNIEEATALTLRVHANAVDVGSDNDTLDLDLRINNVRQGAQTFTPTEGAYGWLEATYTGSWTQSDIDSLEVIIEREVQGGGNPAGRGDEIRVSTVYVDMTYESASLLEQSSYRWFENANSASSDGVAADDWIEATTSAGWDDRQNLTVESFDNRLWVLGGDDGISRYQDVWYSNDNGESWTETAVPGWSERSSHASAVFDNKLWVMGGDDSANVSDVWSSADGETWVEETGNAGWSGRNSHASAVFDNKLWVMGGYDGSNALNDVWYSEDGVNWTEATANAGWSERDNLAVASYDGKLWVVGGLDNNLDRVDDVWYSEDGVNWTEATANADWSARSSIALEVLDDKLWVMGGNDGSNTLNDVWYSEDGVNWTEAAVPGWSGRSSHASTVSDNKLWIMGGNDGSNVSDVWYAEVDEGSVALTGDALADQNQPAELERPNQSARLRVLVDVDTKDADPDVSDLKLQYAPRVGDACVSDFSSFSYSTISEANGDIDFTNNEALGDGIPIESDPNDPSNQRTTVPQTYVAANNFEIIETTEAGQTAMWDFAIKDAGALGGSYCFRIVRADLGLLDAYQHIPELSTAPRPQQQLRHGQYFDASQQRQPFFW